jgi:aminopeptidase
MADPRHEKLAQVLVRYSLGLEPGDKLAVATQLGGVPLAREVYRQALRAGAHPVARVSLAASLSPLGAFDSLGEVRLREGSDEQVGFIDLDLQEMERYDAMLLVWADENTMGLSSIDPSRIAAAERMRAPVMARMMERAAAGDLRWCGTVFPTQAHAQDAGMALDAYEDFVFGAGLLDRDDPAAAWREVGVELARVAAFLGAHDEIRIEAPGTDLTYRVGGRTWIAAAGTNNFPDGEVFTGPVEGSANGTVRFTYPAIYAGNEVEDVRLAFRDGRVVEASAARGQAFLEAMLDQDPGARFLGEAAFGMNYGIGRFTRNILFDEKIGGTMHLALGQSYPETGGTNESGLHWDMICDLRQGRVYADGEPCYAEGKFTI